MASNKAFIRNIDSLQQFKTSLSRYHGNINASLISLDIKLDAIKSNFESDKIYFERKIDEAKYEVANAKRMYNSCLEAKRNDDSESSNYNCDYELQNLLSAKNKLNNAIAKYEEFKSLLREFETSIKEYNAKKKKFSFFLEKNNEAGIHSISQLINGADDYISIVTPAQFSSSFTDYANTPTDSEDSPSNLLIALLKIHVDFTKLSIDSIFFFLNEALFGIKLNNQVHKNYIRTFIEHQGTNELISEVVFDKNLKAIINNIRIPDSLLDKKIGKYIIENIELNCRSLNCKEIKVWSSKENVNFFNQFDFKLKDNQNNDGGYMIKTLNNNYEYLQDKIKANFQNLNSKKIIKEFFKEEVNPLLILTPEDFDDQNFWKQRGADMSVDKYVELLADYYKVVNLINSGHSLDEILKIDDKAHNAYHIFKNQPVILNKLNGFYQVEQGRHRVMAAQDYFIKTGKIIPLPAKIIEFSH